MIRRKVFRVFKLACLFINLVKLPKSDYLHIVKRNVFRASINKYFVAFLCIYLALNR